MLDSDNLSVDKSKLIYVTSSLSSKCVILLGVFDKLVNVNLILNPYVSFRYENKSAKNPPINPLAPVIKILELLNVVKFNWFIIFS